LKLRGIARAKQSNLINAINPTKTRRRTMTTQEILEIGYRKRVSMALETQLAKRRMGLKPSVSAETMDQVDRIWREALKLRLEAQALGKSLTQTKKE
jgi:hypothetical protein